MTEEIHPPEYTLRKLLTSLQSMDIGDIPESMVDEIIKISLTIDLERRK